MNMTRKLWKILTIQESHGWSNVLNTLEVTFIGVNHVLFIGLLQGYGGCKHPGHG